MADEQYRWLDRDAAERLLRGELLEAVGDTAREQAARLAGTLSALAPGSPSEDAELAGEKAALDAFRAARAAGGTEAESPAPPAYLFPGADAGLVRLGRPAPGGRRVRPGHSVRLGSAAALAVVMAGGVAVAAGTGALPTPFDGAEPEPGSSVTALVSPRPSGTAPADGSGTASPDGTGEDAAGGSPRDATGDGSGGSARPGSGGDGSAVRGSHEWWSAVLGSCRDVRRGRALDSGRSRTLDDAAGGHGRVESYCRTVLKQQEESTHVTTPDPDSVHGGQGRGEGGDATGDGDGGLGQGQGDGGQDQDQDAGKGGTLKADEDDVPRGQGPRRSSSAAPTPAYTALDRHRPEDG
jgi:hypothetical protein